jgi:hypothetical protein
LEREAGCVRSSKHGEAGEAGAYEVVVTDIFGRSDRVGDWRKIGRYEVLRTESCSIVSMGRKRAGQEKIVLASREPTKMSLRRGEKRR